jgi:hypothetical protein
MSQGSERACHAARNRRRNLRIGGPSASDAGNKVAMFLPLGVSLVSLCVGTRAFDALRRFAPRAWFVWRQSRSRCGCAGWRARMPSVGKDAERRERAFPTQSVGTRGSACRGGGDLGPTAPDRLANSDCRSAGPSADLKCKWIIYLRRWSAKGLADLL